MPNAKDIQILAGTANNAFISPFSDRPPTSFYSSIVVPRAKQTDSCVPCAVTEIRRSALSEFLIEIATSNKVLAKTEITTAQTIPEIPPLQLP
jgi:hypothetical protein